MHTDIIIVGAGPVGIFTAFQAGMLGMKTHIIDSLPSVGGQCTALYPEKFIYDIPGYKQITAASLISNLVDQADRFSPTYHTGQFVTHLEKADDSFTVKTSKGLEIQSKAVIIAAGAGAFDYNKIPIDSSEIYEGKSLFYSVQDVELFRNKTVAIAGGGDSAADWGVILADIAKQVYVIHRRSKFRCLDSTFTQLRNLENTGKVRIVTPCQITDIEGIGTQITRIELTTLSGESMMLETDYLLAFFGLKPSLNHLENWSLDIINHSIKVDPISCSTNIDGVYAVGDVASYESKLKLILCGFSESAIACHHIHKRVSCNRAYNFQYSTSMTEVFK
ncbi:pyridine nucleotide-disulfide oxidoreductase family protein [Neorickettsia helminthoeca str. Oregon]|uniref:Ferredoxin--NADP reductase n=1 Tax=Neorickettsia helminthoeca str. Oregon TaxID=1286528 RepID=X5H4N5_9RICK|nr:NAD(P)/FAD-dependent oxidoreductase [Neorickettsia helminthoeca]AHX11668.1 pyridine nucleotide-disulfide oxidoreductase family protein [Neorickettsia helminthoeca str. Oregon]